MQKKHITFFFILILFFIFLGYGIKEQIIKFLLLNMKKINQWSYFFNFDKKSLFLLYEYEKIKKKYEQLVYLEKELIQYKNRINNSNTYNKNLLFAEIIGYIQNKKYKFFFINRGCVDGVLVNMIVINGITILGKVIEVGSHYSKVLFLDNIEQYVSVIFEKNNIKGILKGNRDNEENTMSLIHMYNDTKDIINIDEKVYSSGKGLLFPPGYLIGKVKKIDTINCLQKNIIIENDYDLKTLQYCEVILDDILLDKNINEPIKDSISYELIDTRE